MLSANSVFSFIGRRSDTFSSPYAAEASCSHRSKVAGKYLYWTYDIASPLNCYLNDIPSLYELSYKMSQHEHYFGLELKISYLKFQSRQMLKQ